MLIVDTWAIPASVTNPFQVLQSIYIDQASIRSIKIQWLSSCPKVRPIRLEWKYASQGGFSSIPVSSFSHSLGNVFHYSEMVSTCRMNKYYTNPVIVDYRIIEGLEKRELQAKVSFHNEDNLPLGLTLDPQDGTISGFPTLETWDKKVRIFLTVQTSSSEYTFRVTVIISVMGSR